MDNYIEITGCDLAALVKKAYALSRPQGMGFLHFQEGEMSDEQAQEIVSNPRGISLDYVQGRAVKFWIKKEGDRLFVPNSWYDHSDEQLRELLQHVGVQWPEQVTEPQANHAQLSAPATDITTRVKKTIAEQLGLELSAVTNEKAFLADLGADSLDEIELVMAVEDEFGIEIPDDDAEKITTVKAAVDYVVGRVPAY